MAGDLLQRDMPLVSVVLTTRDRPRLFPIALACYQHQTYPRRELIVVDDGADSPVDECVVTAVGGRLIRVEPGTPLGTKLNWGAAAARGVLCQKMDDDDWYAPCFLETMVSALLASWRRVCVPTLTFLMPFLFFDLARWEVRRSAAANAPGATLLFARDDWQERGFRAVRRDEDVWFVQDQTRAGVKLLPVRAPELFLAVRHRGSTRDRGHTWTHQGNGQILEEYMAERPLHEGGPEELLPDWALEPYRELRRDLAATLVPGGAPGAARDDTSGALPAGAPEIAFRTLKLKNGITFQIAFDTRATDPISQSIAALDPWFLDDYAVLLDGMKPGDTVLDLGGHVGTFALAAAALGCRVLCVEAAPANVALLRASVARNGFDRLHVISAAVADRDAVLEFLPNGPWGTVSNPVVARSPALITASHVVAIGVTARTVDGLLGELGRDHVDVVKMDVEGSEIAAIAGMTRLFARPDAPLVFYESNGHTLRFFGQTPAQLTAALERFGYDSYLVQPGRLIPRSSRDLHIEGVVNCLAAKGARPRIEGWPVTPPRSNEEVAQSILGECLHPNRQHRAYIARALATAERRLLSAPEVRYGLRMLRRDADEDVRAAAAWSDPALLVEPRAGQPASQVPGRGRTSR